MERRTCNISDSQRSLHLLTKRQKDAIDMHNGFHASNGDRESNGFHEDIHGSTSTAVLLGLNLAVKNSVRPVKLPEVKRLPPYTTWIFLDRFVEIIYILHCEISEFTMSNCMDCSGQVC